MVVDLVTGGARRSASSSRARASSWWPSSSPTSCRRCAAARRPSRRPTRRLHVPAAARARGRLVSGELLAVVTTDALELGIDIGALDAAVVVTFPGTVASLRQMWGRAGRRGRGLAVYVAGEDALDQFFCRHPDEFLDRPVEAAILDHENEQIHLAHLLCAAHEGPLARPTPNSSGRAGARSPSASWRAGELVERRGRFVPAPARGLPGRARLAALGLAGRVRDRRRHIGRDARHGRGGAGVLDRPRRRDLPAPGAHLRGRASSTSTARRALVQPFYGNWYTQPKKETDT